MIITEITNDYIYCYHDYTFFVFDNTALTIGGNAIGVAWAAGKAKDPLDAPLNIIKKDTCYHNILINHLIDKAKENEDDKS